MDNFKAAVHHVRGGVSVAWDTGVSSELTSLPVGFEHRTMLVAGRGITATMERWGRALRKSYGTQRLFDRNVVRALPHPCVCLALPWIPSYGSQPWAN
jgi:hypothetical protein